MGNANEKALMEQVARSPAVQNIVHETAAKLARVLSASTSRSTAPSTSNRRATWCTARGARSSTAASTMPASARPPD